MTLYELTEKYRQLLELAEDPDIDTQVIADTMESMDGELEEKADGYAKVMAELKAQAEAIGAEIQRLQARKKSLDANVERMKDVLQAAMVATGKRKFKTDLFSFSVQKNGGALPVIVDVDASQLPDDLLIITKVPNRQALARLIERVPDTKFAHFGERGESLRIR